MVLPLDLLCRRLLLCGGSAAIELDFCRFHLPDTADVFCLVFEVVLAAALRLVLGLGMVDFRLLVFKGDPSGGAVDACSGDFAVADGIHAGMQLVGQTGHWKGNDCRKILAMG